MDHFVIVSEYDFVSPRIVNRDTIESANKWWEIEKADMGNITRLSMYCVTDNTVYMIMRVYTLQEGEKTYDY